MNRLSQVLTTLDVAPWHTSMPTSYIHTCNKYLQSHVTKHCSNCSNKALPAFPESLNRKKLHKNNNDVVRPCDAQKRTKCCVTLQEDVQTGCAQPSPCHLALVFIVELGHNFSDLPCSPSLQSLLSPPWPSGEAGIPSVSDSSQITPVLSTAWAAAQLNQSRAQKFNVSYPLVNIL